MTRNHAAVILATILATACADTEGPAGAEAIITVAEGGIIEIGDGAASLEFPPNALTEDLAITLDFASLERYRPLLNGRDRVLTIEPEGVVLAGRARLTLSPGEPAVQPSQDVGLAQLRGGEWVPIESALDDALAVNGSIGELAPVAVVVIERAAGGGIRGFAYDSQERLLSGLPIELVADGQVVRTTTSSSEGEFEIAGVAAGSYSLRTSAGPEGCRQETPVTVVEQETAQVSLFVDLEDCPLPVNASVATAAGTSDQASGSPPFVL